MKSVQGALRQLKGVIGSMGPLALARAAEILRGDEEFLERLPVGAVLGFEDRLPHWRPAM